MTEEELKKIEQVDMDYPNLGYPYGGPYAIIRLLAAEIRRLWKEQYREKQERAQSDQSLMKAREEILLSLKGEQTLRDERDHWKEIAGTLADQVDALKKSAKEAAQEVADLERRLGAQHELKAGWRDLTFSARKERDAMKEALDAALDAPPAGLECLRSERDRLGEELRVALEGQIPCQQDCEIARNIARKLYRAIEGFMTLSTVRKEVEQVSPWTKK